MSGTRSSIRCIRCVVGFLLVACLVAGLSLPALAQTAAPNSPQLSEEQKARLRQAAGDSRLEPWQRDFMDQLGDGEWGMFATLSGRWYHTAIYDPVRDRMIVFGGEDNSWPPRDDVWALSLTGTAAWTEITPAGTRPAGRLGHTAIYDPVRDCMVVFGGRCGPYASDTWALSLAGTPAWTEINPAGTLPSGRWGHSAIYDSERDRMVVFGGMDGDGRCNDTWALSLGGTPSWSELTPSGTPPVPRNCHSAIYDPVRDRMVIFSGRKGPSLPHANDVWALSFAGEPSWSELTPSGTLPSERAGSSGIYDPSRDRMLIFGGFDDTNPPGAGNDTWALSFGDAPAWSRLNPSGTLPVKRELHVAIYDPVRDRMVLFAGSGTNDFVDDTWALTLAGTPTWSELTPPGTPPAKRSDHTAIYDPVRDRMVVFGGADNHDVFNDTWVLSLSGTPAWTELAPLGTPPSARGGHTAIYDPVRDRMVVFGGGGNDTWALSLGESPTWSELSPSGTAPSARSDHTAIYDPVRDRMVVFGGGSGGGNDTWVLSLAGTPAWHILVPLGTPPPVRGGHTAIYDPVRDRMVVFGGYDLNDTWALSFSGMPAWSRLTPSDTLPPERFRHTAVYDPVRDRMIIFGGDHGPFGTPYLNDTWSLSLGETPTWSELVLPYPPKTRRDHTAIYDPARDRMVVFGGNDASQPHYDTYGLAWTAAAVPGPGPELPVGLALHAPCPNPASGPTVIRFDLPVRGAARLAIYDVAGRLVRRLMEGDVPAGAQHAEWDGRDEAGRDAAPGIYFARLEATGRNLTERVVILR